MRKKLVRNYLFYQHYPYKPSSSDLSTVSHRLSSLCSFCYGPIFMVYAGSCLSWMESLGSLVYIVCRRQDTEKGDEKIHRRCTKDECGFQNGKTNCRN